MQAIGTVIRLFLMACGGALLGWGYGLAHEDATRWRLTASVSGEAATCSLAGTPAGEDAEHAARPLR